MPAQAQTFPFPEQIFANSQDMFEVVLTEWGTNIKDAFPAIIDLAGNPLNRPGFPFTPEAITLGPRSTIDRCFVSWNYQGRPSANAQEIRTLTRDAPLCFAQAAGPQGGHLSTADLDPIITTAMARGLLYVTPHVSPPEITENNDPTFGFDIGFRTTLLPTSYIKADGTTTANFFNPGGNTNVMRPVLHLQYWLKAASAFTAPTKRAPWFNSFHINNAGGLGVESLVFGWPVYGRKTISLQVSAQAAGTNFRVAALRNVQRYVLSQETTEGSLAGGAANNSTAFRFCDLAADYLMLYITPTNANGQIVNGTIAAYD